MIPITVSIFGARAGVPRGRALLLATAYVPGIAALFGTLGSSVGLLGRAFGTFLANLWVMVPLALLLRMPTACLACRPLELPSSSRSSRDAATT